jgi:hypothetical protein
MKEADLISYKGDKTVVNIEGGLGSRVRAGGGIRVCVRPAGIGDISEAYRKVGVDPDTAPPEVLAAVEPVLFRVGATCLARGFDLVNDRCEDMFVYKHTGPAIR